MDNAGHDGVGRFPVSIIQKPCRPCYLYRLTENDQLCYRFSVFNNPKKIECNGCHLVYNKNLREKLPYKRPEMLTIVDSWTASDASKCHLEGCQPLNYEETIKEYKHVADQNKSKPSKGSILEKVLKDAPLMIMYHDQDNTSLCYRFTFRKLTPSGLRTVCCQCFSIQATTKNTRLCFYTVNADGFSSDPRLGHLPRCKPIQYKQFMVKHILLNKDDTRKTMLEWCRLVSIDSDVPEANRDTVAVQEPLKDDVTGIPGVSVIETKSKVQYFYRIPDSDKCIQFMPQTSIKKTFSLTCVFCNTYYSRMHQRGQKTERHCKSRVSDEFSMECDPKADHVPECEPELYSQVLRYYRPITIENTNKGDYQFPLIKMRKRGQLEVLYRLDGEPNKCYTFMYNSRRKKDWFLVECSTCYRIGNSLAGKGKTRAAGRFHRFNETGFLDDPIHNHYKQCKPHLISDVIRKSSFVDKATADEFIKGTVEHSGDETMEEDNSEYPVQVVQRRHAVSFVYRNPNNPFMAYQFYQLNHLDNTRLVCRTCLFEEDDDRYKSVVARKSDSFSMKSNPLKGHEIHCRGVKYNELWKKTSHREDGSTKEDRKYKFALEKREEVEKHFALYRLKEDPTKCLRFNVVEYSAKHLFMRLQCSSCQAIYNKSRQMPNEKNNATNLYGRMQNCTAAGFLGDPTVGHAPGCEPFQYNDVMKNYALVEKKEARKFFSHRYAMTRTKGFELAQRIQNKPRVQAPSQEEDDDINEESEGEKGGLDSTTTNDGNDGREVVAGPNKQSGNSFVNLGATDEEPVGDNDDQLILDNSSTFSRIYEVPFFNDNDAKITIKGRKVIMEFKRESTSIGVEGGFLCYSVELPQSIDISNVQIKWKPSQMTLTADRMP